ncbi:hypothetical protein PFISCL1PPCAC_877, partial [Pristionchus fissidentatus]
LSNGSNDGCVGVGRPWSDAVREYLVAHDRVGPGVAVGGEGGRLVQQLGCRPSEMFIDALPVRTGHRVLHEHVQT